MHVVGTAGHVDHGKSTLVMALTGMDPDRLDEEKRRGLTIDLGFAWCELPSGREIGIVDVPGHERFIRNMLAGVGAVDAAILVVAADEGWKPQSDEHLQILDFLEVGSGVVALTKCDLVTEEAIEQRTREVEDRLSGTCLSGAAVVPVSGSTGAGLDALTAELDSMLEGAGAAPDRGRPRLFVDRSFTISGAGTVVTGTLTGGRLRSGEEVVILPQEDRARIRSLQTHRASVDEAVPGSRVAVNLVGVDRGSVRRGDALVSDRWMLSDRFAARLRTVRNLTHTVDERGAYELFVGSAQMPCRLRFLEDTHDLRPAGTALVEVFCDRRLPLVPGDRFVVRDVGRWETVAGGVVLDPAPPRLRRNDERARRLLRVREGLTGSALAARVIVEKGSIPREELRALTGAGPGEIEDAVEREATVVSNHVLSHERAAALERETREALASFHAGNPLAPGMAVDKLSAALGLDRSVLDELAAAWAGAGWLVREANVVRLAEHGAALSPEQRGIADRALGALRTAGTSPPALRDIGLPMELAKAMERTGELVLVTPDIAYPAEVWSELQARVVRMIVSTGPVTVSRVREELGTSRKYAVPLLERLDAAGVTRRRGDVRELGPRGREIAPEH